MNENKLNSSDTIEQQNEIHQNLLPRLHVEVSSLIDNLSQQQQQQPLENMKLKTKKKCRGNRKAQRQRRKLRQKCMTSNKNNEIANSIVDHEHNDKEEKKQTFDGVNKDEDISNVDKSFNQIPLPNYTETNMDIDINQKSMKRKRNRMRTNKSINEIHKSLSELSTSELLTKKQKLINHNEELNNSTIRLKIMDKNSKRVKERTITKKQKKINKENLYIPDYLKVSNNQFRQMLMNSLENVDDIVNQLNTNEKLDFFRHYTCLLHRFFYVQLQEDQWKYYYDVGIKENIWSGRVSKKWATINSMYYTYGRSKQLIEQRLKTIERQHQEALQELTKFANQSLPSFLLEMNPPLDFTKLSTMITSIVRKGQYKLKQQFEYNKKILMLDSMDHHLVKQVYDLKPNQQQIRYIRNYWKAIYNKSQMEEQIQILKHRIHSNCLPPALNLLDDTLDHIHQILTHSQSSFIDENNKDEQTILAARRLKKIGRFKYDLLELSIGAAEEKVRYWNQIAEKEKSKLLMQIEKLKNSKMNSNDIESLITTIEARKEHMIKRFNYITQEKLKSFFDMAPTSQDMIIDQDDGVGVNQF